MLFQSNHVKLWKQANNLKLKKFLFAKKLRLNFRYKEYIVYIPLTWSFTLVFNKRLNTKCIYSHSNYYYARFSTVNNLATFGIDGHTNNIVIKSVFTHSCYSIFLKSFEAAITNFIKPSFKKLKFKGKGYYIYKNTRNTITPQFGYAHRFYMYSYFVTVKFLGKTKILLFGFNNDDIFKAANSIKSKRPINIFTGRGVRFARQVIYKKQGKVSSYR